MCWLEIPELQKNGGKNNEQVFPVGSVKNCPANTEELWEIEIYNIFGHSPSFR